MAEFRVGQKVRCKSNAGFANQLTVLKVYTIIASKYGCYYIYDDTGKKFGFEASRFEKTEYDDLQLSIGDTVICINSSERDHITVGKSYVVLGVSHGEKTIDIRADNGVTFKYNSCRFEIVELADILPSKEYKEATKGQVGGNHYEKLAIQPVEYGHKNNLSFLQTSVVKYITRYKDKGGKEDLLKAKHCIDKLIAYDYPDKNLF